MYVFTIFMFIINFQGYNSMLGIASIISRHASQQTETIVARKQSMVKHFWSRLYSESREARAAPACPLMSIRHIREMLSKS